MTNQNINVALIGNPRQNLSFNQLTGLNQQVGNYPELRLKKDWILQIPNNAKANILDLPGTYSLNASSIDENVVIECYLTK
jgi:ferrous iron transport protein B